MDPRFLKMIFKNLQNFDFYWRLGRQILSITIVFYPWETFLGHSHILKG